MYLLELLRNKVFWWSDYLKGNKITFHYNDIKSILDDYSLPSSKNKSANNLKKLIKHAVSTVSFYKENGGMVIEEFPVINKNIIRENINNFKSSEYVGKPFVSMTTSGSTGTPFTVLQDINKKNRNLADTLYFAEKGGYHIGEKLGYLKIWSSSNKKAKKQLVMQNIIPVDVLNLDDDAVKEFLDGILKDKATFNMLGYSSAYDVICDYMDRKNYPQPFYHANSIISMSETLEDFTKERLGKYFSTKPVSRYSNLENGIIAQQCKEENTEYHINSASYYIEILDMNEDKPVAPGEEGRIVVTDLFNFFMPMLRYDTGDIGILGNSSKCSWNSPVLTKVEGRKLDLIFKTNGERVSSYIVYKNMWQYTELKQYQLIQYDNGKYLMKINTDDEFTRSEQLINEFKFYLGEDADFKIEVVDEIPLLNSGKRKKNSKLNGQKISGKLNNVQAFF